MFCPPIARQLINVAQAPMIAIIEGEPLQGLGGEYAGREAGLPLSEWHFQDGALRSWHGLMASTPGALHPAAPTGLVPDSMSMLNTGDIITPEQLHGRVVRTTV